MRVFLHELQHLVHVDVDDHGRQLPDPRQRHPQVFLLEGLAPVVPQARDSLLDLWEVSFMIRFRELPDEGDGLLLTGRQLASLLELSGAHDQPPVRLRLFIDPRLLDREFCFLRVALGEAASLGDPPAALLEELLGAPHLTDVVEELVLLDLAGLVLIDGIHQLVDVRLGVREAQVLAHVLHVLPAQLTLLRVVEAREGRLQGFVLGLRLRVQTLQQVLGVGVPRARGEGVLHKLHQGVELVVLVLEPRAGIENLVQLLLGGALRHCD
mmetsp:Transcript_63549/g.171491  ORF Transcript_63549/g.171491 Transcript_63549/m.171491 type:complete len:268 (-) Transcript_63549:17-820(-)